MPKEIIVYSKDTCGPCQQLKKFMKLKGLSYVEKSVDNPDNAAEAFGYSGQMIVPVTVIKKQDDSQSVVSGYNIGSLAKALA